MTGSVRFALLGILIALRTCRDITPPQNVAEAKEVTFDGALRYPTKIDICCIEDDSGVVYRIGNLAQVGVLQ